MIRATATLFFLCAISTLQGCGPTKPAGPYHADAPKPPESTSLATIFLIFNSYSNERVDFLINDKHYFSASMNHYSWIQIEPGKHEIKAVDSVSDRSFFGGSAKQEHIFTKQFDAGEKYYISLNTQRKPTGKQIGLITPYYVEITDGFDQSRKYKELPADRADVLMHFNIYIPATPEPLPSK